jgi:hypothetical protein
MHRGHQSIVGASGIPSLHHGIHLLAGSKARPLLWDRHGAISVAYQAHLLGRSLPRLPTKFEHETQGRRLALGGQSAAGGGDRRAVYGVVCTHCAAAALGPRGFETRRICSLCRRDTDRRYSRTARPSLFIETFLLFYYFSGSPSSTTHDTTLPLVHT